MRLAVLLVAVATAAVAEVYEDLPEVVEVEVDAAEDEYPESPFLNQRAAAAISSTDYRKEKDVLKEQAKIKKPKYPPPPPPPYPGPPPYLFANNDFDIENVPPLPPYNKVKKSHAPPPPPPPPYPWLDEDDELDVVGDAAPPRMKYPPFPPYPSYPKPPRCPNMCDLDLYKKCTCKSPAMYTKDGRGNCNVGASKLDLRVWCYIDDSNGPPEKICPDALPSKSMPGHWWSRIACITG
eukprot:TRINITY_DN1238_c0_g1_i1.p1 TRINITY_DN1238_c0_g1~~TRINITY_DN1238_c0_g1_i1.p1  ORF type:complete len:237 (-),score=61.54 TRINITY_DN1238_c0_g1_i1:151-861(-)